MTTISAGTRVTPDDLLALEEEGLFELVDSKLVEKQRSYLSSQTAGIIAAALLKHARALKLGDVLSEQTFRCFPDDPDKIRRPDVAFIAARRVPAIPPEGHVTVAPDLVVEVVSPNDKIYELDEKLDDYRSAGVKLVWVVNPNSRVIRVHRLDRTTAELFDNDTLRGESVLPEFAVLVRDLLPEFANAKS